MKADQLNELIRVADASFLAAQTKLSDLRNQEKLIRDQLNSLKTSQKEAAALDRSSGDPALKAGADDRWYQWISGRKSALNTDLARIQALKTQQFDIVKRAFGRRQAMRAVAAKRRAEARQVIERRSQY